MTKLNLNQEPAIGFVLEAHSFKQAKVLLPKYGRAVIDKELNRIKLNIGEPHRPVWITLATTDDIPEATTTTITTTPAVNTNETLIEYETHKPVIYIKTFPLFDSSGTATIDVTGWIDRYQILDIGIKLLQGTAGEFKAGLSLGGDDVIMPTDLSYMTIGGSQAIYCSRMFSTGQNTVYLTMTGGSGALYNIFLKLIKFI